MTSTLNAVPSLERLATRLAGRRVLVTGHTGFKGSWLSIWLSTIGAEVAGYSVGPPTTPSLFEAADVGSSVQDHRGNVEDMAAFGRVYDSFGPDLVVHLAAQPLVRASYLDPVGTITTNVVGTTHVLELARRHGTAAVVIVTTDKCYENLELRWGYREHDRLGGSDPYSASKACAELITSAYRRSFFDGGTMTAVASARAGNVIGGGDWADDRIVPDIVRSIEADEPVRLRNPYAVRPWQHVIESLSGYVTLGALLLGSSEERELAAQEWNFGPRDSGRATVEYLAERVTGQWGQGKVELTDSDQVAKESQLLTLNIEKAEQLLAWLPRWSLDETIDLTVDWYRRVGAGEPARALCEEQLDVYASAAQRADNVVRT
jgi:CDP-glucose 4,6-dehydratase